MYAQLYNIQTSGDKHPKHAICSLYLWHIGDLDAMSRSSSYNDNLDLKKGYSYAKFERSCFYGVWEKTTLKILFNEKYM